MRKKMCDHPAGILFAIIVALLIVLLNFFTIGSTILGWMVAVAIVLIYVVFCFLCKKKENNEND